MKLTPFDRSKIGKGKYVTGSAQRIVIEFRDSGLDCVKVEDYPHKTASSCAATLTGAIKTLRANNIRAMIRCGNVFLVREKP